MSRVSLVHYWLLTIDFTLLSQMTYTPSHFYPKYVVWCKVYFLSEDPFNEAWCAAKRPLPPTKILQQKTLTLRKYLIQDSFSSLPNKKVREIMSDPLWVTRMRNECQNYQAPSSYSYWIFAPKYVRCFQIRLFLTLILSRIAEDILACLLCGCNRPVRQYAPSSNPSGSPEPPLPFSFLKGWVSWARESEDSCRL